MLHEYVKLIWVINRQLCAYQNDMCNLPNLFAKHWRTQRLYFVACGICSRPAQWVGAPVWSVLGWWHSLSPYTSHHKSNGLFLWFYPLYSSFCSKWGEQNTRFDGWFNEGVVSQQGLRSSVQHGDNNPEGLRVFPDMWYCHEFIEVFFLGISSGSYHHSVIGPYPSYILCCHHPQSAHSLHPQVKGHISTSMFHICTPVCTPKKSWWVMSIVIARERWDGGFSSGGPIVGGCRKGVVFPMHRRIYMDAMME